MVKPLIGIKVQVLDGVVYINGVRCDQTETDLSEIPCPCEGSPGTGTPSVDPPPIPNENLCQVANYLAIFAYNAGYYLWNVATGQPDNAFGWFIAASDFVFFFRLPALYQPIIAVYLQDHRADLLTATGFGSPQNAGAIQEAMVCQAYNALTVSGGVVNADWKEAFIALMAAEAPLPGMPETAWDAMSVLCDLIGVDIWQYWSWILSGDDYDPGYNMISFDHECACGDSPTLECDEFTLDANFLGTGLEYEFTGYLGSTNQFPTGQVNVNPVQLVDAIRTGRAFEVPNICAGSNTCYTAGIVRFFDTPISLCSVQTVCSIFLKAPDDLDYNTGNSSRMGVYYKVQGDPVYKILHEVTEPIGRPVPRGLRWSGLPIENVTELVVLHRAGGSYGAIERVLINLPLYQP